MPYGQQIPSNMYSNYIPQNQFNNYPNQNPNGYYPQQTMQYQQAQSQQYAMQQQNAQPAFIRGKFVESADILKVTEVPMGETLVCPKADYSEIYVKSWNPNGTTRIVTFRPVLDSTDGTAPAEEIKMSEIMSRLDSLDQKMDKFVQELGGAS